MRVSIGVPILFSVLAACTTGQPAQAPPPPAPVAAPAPQQAGAPPGMGGSAFDGHYVGSGIGSGGPAFCSRDENFDFTVSNGQVSGTVAVPVQRGRGKSAATATTLRSDLTGTVDASGQANLQLHPLGTYSPRGTAGGQFANGRFTGHTGAPCNRTISESRA